MKQKKEEFLILLILGLLFLIVGFVSFQFGRIKGHQEARWYVETGKLPDFSPAKDIWNY